MRRDPDYSANLRMLKRHYWDGVIAGSTDRVPASVTRRIAAGLVRDVDDDSESQTEPNERANDWHD